MNILCNWGQERKDSISIHMISKDINDNSTTNNSSHLNEHKFPYANESSVECSKVLDLNVDFNIDSDTSKISYKSNHSSSNSNDIDLVQTKKFDFIPEYARNYLFYIILKYKKKFL